MFLHTEQGTKTRAEAGKPGPNTAHAEMESKQGTQPGAGRHNTAHHSRGNGKQAKTRNPGPTPPTTHAETASKARNPGPNTAHHSRGNGKRASHAPKQRPVSPYSKRPRLKSGAFFIFAS